MSLTAAHPWELPGKDTKPLTIDGQGQESITNWDPQAVTLTVNCNPIQKNMAAYEDTVRLGLLLDRNFNYRVLDDQKQDRVCEDNTWHHV